MRLSQAGIGKTRLQNVDKMFPAQDILLQSGQIVQFGTGIYGYNNVPLKVKQKIETIIREELTKCDCTEIELPTLQTREMWESSGRWSKYVESGTMLTINTGKGEFCLAPTAEEAVVEFAKRKIKSHKDLPTTFFQIGEKYRNELRTRGYLLRGKSFPMMDAYSFNRDETSLLETYETIKQGYLNIFQRLGLPVVPVVADNGAIGGKKSEEFMVLSEIGEDTILYDEATGIALNSEILEREDYKEYLKSEYSIGDITKLEPRKAIELGHIFQLGKTYSENMRANYVDANGKEKPFYMGCYGIGVSRTLAAIYERSVIRDKNGLAEGISLPCNIAPYFMQIIPKPDSEKKVQEAEELYQIMLSKGIGVILDDRKDTSIGSSIKDCKVLGTPYIIILGDKVKEGEIEIESTKTGKKIIVQKSKIVDMVDKKDIKQEMNQAENLMI